MRTKMSNQNISDYIMSKPRGRNGGRKPSFIPPKDRRTAQLRASQNAFQKRKVERLQELEKKEAQLALANSENRILKKENELLYFMLRSLVTEQNTSSDKRNIGKTCCEKYSSQNNIFDGSLMLSTTYNSLEIQQCYVFFTQLLSICAGKNCMVPPPLDFSDRPFRPLGCMNLSANVFDESFLDHLINEDRTFDDFNIELHDISSKPNVTLLTESNNFIAEVPNSVRTESESTVTCPGLDLNEHYTAEVFESDVLLRATDVWHFMKTHAMVNKLDLEGLGLELKKNAVCLNSNILISLKHFIRVFSSSL